MEWHLVCAMCGNIVESFRHMHKLHSTYICKECAYENNATLDDYIHIGFTISRSVREIKFHHPESLSADDLFFKYNLCRGAHSWWEGWDHEQLFRAVTKFLDYLEPGETRRLEFPVELGFISLANVTDKATLGFLVGSEPASDVQTISTYMEDGKLHVIDLATVPPRADFGYVVFSFDELSHLKTGHLTLEIENRMDHKACTWVAHFQGTPPTRLLTFDPFLSGKRLITTQTFRNLFRSETVSADEGIGIKDITFLFTDLKGSTALYDQIGDPKAYFLVRQHFDTLGKVVNRYEGATIKTIGDAVMATFLTPLDAARASLTMLQDLEALNRNISDKLVLKIGIHSGHSIAVTLNDRLDYFGQTVNLASRIQGLANAGEIYMSEEVYTFPGVQNVIAHCTITSEEVTMKGIRDKIRVFKVSANP
jgi:class 3 adenylate cyclase